MRRKAITNRVPNALGGDWLGRLLSRYYPYALAVCAMVMVMMWQNFEHQKQQLLESQMREQVEAQRRKALVFEAMKAQAMRPTRIKERAELLGLQMSVDPPKKVKINNGESTR